jgi:hypothetical protein
MAIINESLELGKCNSEGQFCRPTCVIFFPHNNSNIKNNSIKFLFLYSLNSAARGYLQSSKNRKQQKHTFFFSMALPAHPWPLIQFRNNFFTDGGTHWTSDQPVAMPLTKHRKTQIQNKRIHTPNIHGWVGFEPTIPASERAMTVHASDRAATVTANRNIHNGKNKWEKN